MTERLVRIGAYVLAVCVVTLVLWIMTDQQLRIQSLGYQLAIAQTGTGVQSARVKIADDFYAEMRQDMADLKDRLK